MSLSSYKTVSYCNIIHLVNTTCRTLAGNNYRHV